MRERLARLLDWFRRDSLERELTEELHFHREQLEREVAGRMRSPNEARHVAARRMGQ